MSKDDIEVTRTPAQFFFEIGWGACWAEAYVRNGETAPFPLTDATVERAWDIAGEAHDDPEEFDRYEALANASVAATPPSPPAMEEVTIEGGANSHCFDDRIMVNGECVAFSDEPWSSRIATSLTVPEPDTEVVERVAETREGFAPCPLCKQYSHSIGTDALAAAFNHFHIMIAHPVRGHPMGFAFDEKTRDAAQVLLAALRPQVEGEG